MKVQLIVTAEIESVDDTVFTPQQLRRAALEAITNIIDMGRANGFPHELDAATSIDPVFVELFTEPKRPKGRKEVMSPAPDVSNYSIVASAPIGPKVELRLLHQFTTEPDGTGGQFTRHHWRVVIFGTAANTVLAEAPGTASTEQEARKTYKSLVRLAR